MYMEIAGIIAKQSSAKRLQVGAIVVKDDRVISIGYNGMPAGWDNVCEDKIWMDGDAGGWLDVEQIEHQWPYAVYEKGTDPTEESVCSGRYYLKTKPK